MQHVKLTKQERDHVRTWRDVARQYHHGDCGNATHREIGCDVVCLAVYGGRGDLPSPWQVTAHRQLEDHNAAVGLMCVMVTRAIRRSDQR